MIILKKTLSLALVIILAILLNSCNIDVTEIDLNDKTDNAGATTEKNSKTFTGLPALKEIKYDVSDPENKRGLSTEKIAHSFGVAKNGEPHRISVEAQSYFDNSGYKAVAFDTSRKDKVLYLTFDCGYENGFTSMILDTLREKNVKAAFFCTLDDIKSEPELIARMINEGHIVGNHSSSHPSFAEIGRDSMAEEIEECENYLRKNFGYTSKYFRFPKGEYSESALNLVDSLGYTSVFWSLAYNDWNSEQQKGLEYAFDKVTSRLHPGAVILLHSVSSDNALALGDIIDYAIKNNYKFLSLDELNF